MSLDSPSSPAPSRMNRHLQWLPGSWRNLTHSMTAWDKRQRLGEATNPGPEPPRELNLNRKNGQRDPIRLCTQNGGWVWNVHCVPPLRVAKRPTPQVRSPTKLVGQTWECHWARECWGCQAACYGCMIMGDVPPAWTTQVRWIQPKAYLPGSLDSAPWVWTFQANWQLSPGKQPP